jgi:hypothetical protein
MKRLSLIGSWSGLACKRDSHGSYGLAFVGGAEPPTVIGACPLSEGRQLHVQEAAVRHHLDNSSSMNEQFDADTTRWRRRRRDHGGRDYDNGYIAENFILGLIRFGHDPARDPGTTIKEDTSGLIDGQKLDVGWYDEARPAKATSSCTNGDAILAALEAVGPPSGATTAGIGTWTKGAMDFAAAYIAKTKADHPQTWTSAPRSSSS